MRKKTSAGRSGLLLLAIAGAVAGIVILCDRMLPKRSSVPPPNSILKFNVDVDDMKGEWERKVKG